VSIEIKGVSKRFGDYAALRDVSLTVDEGSLTALLGPSGSGKSTLLRIVAGLETPDAGSIHISREESTALPPQKRGVGFVFQHYAAFRHMTVWENVAFGLKIQRRPKAEVSRKVEELLHLVQLDGLARRYPSQLSGGQRQRMALARALAVEPRVLLLDEPFGALDARVRAELRQWLRRLHDEAHVTTVLVTHDQEEAMDVADTIAVMRDGRIVQAGSPQALYEEPASEFVVGFIGHVNRVGGVFIRPHDIHISTVRGPGSLPATFRRLVYLGFDARAEVVSEEGHPLQVQMTRDEASLLELVPGQQVYLTYTRTHVFDEMHVDGRAGQTDALVG